MRVLLTGFGPFPGAPFNPTAALVARLAARRRPALADIVRIAHVFPTSYAAVDAQLPALVARYRPDAMLMFGLAAGTPHLRIEARARNAIAQLVPDATGKVWAGPRIAKGAPTVRAGRAPFARLIAAARAARLPARLSHDAGRYLCNLAYWRALEPRRGRPLVAFVHVPLCARPGGPPGPPDRPGWQRRRRPPAVRDLVRAGEAMLLALIAAARAGARNQQSGIRDQDLVMGTR